VRRNNNNTLSGLSLDCIAQQVKDIIDAREKARMPGGGKGAKVRQVGSPVGRAKGKFYQQFSLPVETTFATSSSGTDSSPLFCGI